VPPSGASHPKRGEVYWVDLSPVVGSEQAGRRPAVVISPNALNRTLPVVVVAAITSIVKDFTGPIAPILPAGQPLPERSQVLTFQVRTLDQSRLETPPAGVLSGEQLYAVARGVAFSFGLTPPPLWLPEEPT
jgi:mRNA interferase MazF